jgi:hypothetical protein
MLHVVVQLDASRTGASATCKVALRVTRRSRRKSSPFNSIKSNAQEHLPVHCAIPGLDRSARSPSGPQATASPSIMRVRALSRLLRRLDEGDMLVVTLPRSTGQKHVG